MKQVTIFTDGGAVPNPGRGGYGVVLRFGGYCKELSGGFKLTTNNRMELMAVIVGLEALKEACQVKVFSDSKYIVDAVNKGSVFRWRENDWRMNSSLNSKRCKNPDLWERLLAAYDKHEVEFDWVKGHAGIHDNERCDQLAEGALKLNDLPDDVGYLPDPKPNKNVESDNNAKTLLMKKVKITAEGQPCRKCQTPVIKRSPKKKTTKPNQSYYYAWYLYCPKCRTMYMVDEAKREVTQDGKRLF